MIAFRLSWRELRNSKLFSLFFVFNLTLGLLGFVVLDTFKVALEQSLSARSKELLSADLAVGSRRELTEEESSLIDTSLPYGTKTGRLVEMYTMASSPVASRLVQLVAIDQSYPFFGEFSLENAGVIKTGAPRAILSSPIAWVYPELGLQLGIKKGDHLKMGDQEFVLGDFIRADSGTAWRGFDLATRVYIGLPQLGATHLIRKGSVLNYSRLYLLPEQASADDLKKTLNDRLTDPSLQVKTYKDASEEIGRLLRILNDYLGLVALVALFLASIGSGYLFRSFISRRTREIAILTSLGVHPREARMIYILNLMMMGALASLVTVLAAWAILPPLGWFVSPFLPFPIELHLLARTVLLSTLMGIFGSVLVCYPLLVRIKDLRPILLFQESDFPSLKFGSREWLAVIPASIAFYALSIWQAHSLKVGSMFIGSLLGSLLVLSAAGALAFRGLGVLEKRAGLRVRSAIRSLRRNLFSSMSCFVAIGIGSLLINLIPAVQENLEQELKKPPTGDTPSLFLYDIQEEQVEPLESEMKQLGQPLLDLSPLVRARLKSINGEPYERVSVDGKFSTREEEQEARSRNRGFNLSYRTGYSPAEHRIAGHDFSGKFTGNLQDAAAVSEISVEKRFAERVHLKLGDLLVFDVQGIPVQARIINFRKVSWTSFRPNFFILFQPGVLDSAPKTFLAAIPKVEVDEKVKIQNDLVKKFPNISMVDMGDVVQKILEIFNQMTLALRVMAGLSFFSGLIVLYSIANHQAESRRMESNLWKILGAGSWDIQSMVALEFLVLGLLASAFGVAISYAMTWLLVTAVFDADWFFAFHRQALSIALITMLCLLTAALATRRVMVQKPAELLGEI